MGQTGEFAASSLIVRQAAKAKPKARIFSTKRHRGLGVRHKVKALITQ